MDIQSLITELEVKMQMHLDKSMQGNANDPNRTYHVGMSEAYNDVLCNLYLLRIAHRNKTMTIQD